MIRGIDPRVTPDLLYALARMGHGDEIAVVDSNYPARMLGTRGTVLEMAGVDASTCVALILDLLPLDNFEPDSALAMAVVGAPDRAEPVHDVVQAIVTAHQPSATLARLERHAFYERAKSCFAVVRACEHRPYGCFILRAGVIGPRGASAR